MAREGTNVIQQLGVQSTPGTTVAATVRLASLGIDIGKELVTKQFRSMGAKTNTTSIIHKKMSRGTFEGPLSYNEIIYILAGMMPTTPSTTTGVTTWSSLPNPIGNDANKVYTLEQGDDEETELFEDLQFQSLDITWGLEDVMVSGNVFSKTSVVKGGGLTTGVALLAERPVSARDITVTVDPTYAGIGSSALTDAFDAKLSIGEKFEPKWVLNKTYTSYKEAYEKIGDLTFTITLEANSQGRNVYNYLIGGGGYYIRVKAAGSDIIGGTPSTPLSITVDFFAKLTSVREMKDYNDSLFAYELTMNLIQESDLGRPYIITTKNGLAAL